MDLALRIEDENAVRLRIWTARFYAGSSDQARALVAYMRAVRVDALVDRLNDRLVLAVFSPGAQHRVAACAQAARAAYLDIGEVVRPPVPATA